jgi:hypothetical protein
MRTKARAIHSEIAQLRIFLNDEAIPADDPISDHLFEGHYDALDEIYLDRMPLAAALDISDLVLSYHGTSGPSHHHTFQEMSRIVNRIHKEIMNVAKTHRNVAGSPSAKWKNHTDLVVTAADPRLIFGFRLPDSDARSTNPNLANFEDPLYIAVKESVELVGAVSASLHMPSPRESISDFTKDKPSMDFAMVDAAIHAARRFIPFREKSVDSVRVGGLALPGGDVVNLGKDERDKATTVLQDTKVPDEDADITGVIMVVDYGTMRCELRNVDRYDVRSVRCQYEPKHEATVRECGKRFVRIRGKATFDRDRKPRFLVAESIEPVSPRNHK